MVLFGEYLPADAVNRMYEQLQQGFDMIFSVGTTSVFPYIAEPVVEARFQGIPTVEINPGDTAVTAYVDYKLAAGAAASLTRLWQRYREELS